MDQLATIERTQIIIRSSREFKVVTSFDAATEARYRDAASAYRRCCEQRPGENRCRIAAWVACNQFEQTIARLQSDSRDAKLAEMRQQLMAFCRVVSFREMRARSPRVAELWSYGTMTPRAITAALAARGIAMPEGQVARLLPNSLPSIGRCFNRSHATVVYAVNKYGEAIANVIND